MENLFLNLQDGNKKGQIRIKPDTAYEWQYVIDENTSLKINNVFLIDEGSKWFDFLRFQDSANFAISKKVKELLEINNLTGWSCFPIIIENASDKEYFCFQITSNKAGKILNKKELLNYIDEFIKFDNSTWDGSDFFTLQETGIVACLPKVKNVLEKSKVTNVIFESL